VTDAPDSTDSEFKFSVPFAGTFDSTRQNGTILKLTYVRINTIDDITTIRPSNGFKTGDTIYVDNDYKTNTGLWKVYQLNDDSVYKTNVKFATDISTGNDTEFG